MMKIIYKNLVRKKVIQMIKKIGGDVSEIVLDIELSEMTINTIEWLDSEKCLLVHVFVDDLDHFYEFDDLSEKDKLIILTTLSFY
jgi:hypothetical protein